MRPKPGSETGKAPSLGKRYLRFVLLRATSRFPVSGMPHGHCHPREIEPFQCPVSVGQISFADSNAVHIYRIDGGSHCGLGANLVGNKLWTVLP